MSYLSYSPCTYAEEEGCVRYLKGEKLGKLAVRLSIHRCSHLLNEFGKKGHLFLLLLL